MTMPRLNDFLKAISTRAALGAWRSVVAKLEWRLRAMMARQRIASYKELAARLCAAGVPISRAQAWRLVTLEPQRIRIRVLAELCEILRWALPISTVEA